MKKVPGGYFHIRRSGGLAPNFASEILVVAPNFASKNINDKYPKFFPLNFRYDPKIGTFSQLLHLLVTELPKFFLLFCELGRTLPQILPPNLMRGPSPAPDSLFGSTPLGIKYPIYNRLHLIADRQVFIDFMEPFRLFDNKSCNHCHV